MSGDKPARHARAGTFYREFVGADHLGQLGDQVGAVTADAVETARALSQRRDPATHHSTHAGPGTAGSAQAAPQTRRARTAAERARATDSRGTARTTADRQRSHGYPSAPPTTTMALVISRKARRQAAAAATAANRRDPQLEAVERALAGVQAAGDILISGLCVISWLWLWTQRSPATTATGAVAQVPAAASGHSLLQPLAASSGTNLVLLLLCACLLLAPVVNPFYSPPARRRFLHHATTATFITLVGTTVAVVTGAAA